MLYQVPLQYFIPFSRYLTLKNIVTLKSCKVLGVTHPANLCTTCTSLKSTDLAAAGILYSMGLFSFTFAQRAPEKLT